MIWLMIIVRNLWNFCFPKDYFKFFSHCLYSQCWYIKHNIALCLNLSLFLVLSQVSYSVILPQLCRGWWWDHLPCGRQSYLRRAGECTFTAHSHKPIFILFPWMMSTVHDLNTADKMQSVLTHDKESDTYVNTLCQNKWLDTSCLQFHVS